MHAELKERIDMGSSRDERRVIRAALLPLALTACAPPVQYVRDVHLEPPPRCATSATAALVVTRCVARVTLTGLHDDVCVTAPELLR